MKKILLIIALTIATTTASAQLQTLGVRMGWGGELSGQFNGGPGRIEADLGMFRNYTSITLAYHLVNELSDNLNWYYGLGGTVGFWENGVAVGAVGVLGIDYTFTEVPIQVSLDWRPVAYVIRTNTVGVLDLSAAGVGIRYKF